MRKDSWEADKKKVADEIADIKADKSKLIEERSACVKETEAARKEKRDSLAGSGGSESAARFQPQGCPQQSRQPFHWQQDQET